MRYLLAVDGGNSKTLAAVADETGQVLSAALSGGCNYQSCGKQAAARAIGEAVGKALSAAGLERVDFACYGIAGADRDKDFETIRGLIAPLDPARESVLVNDTLLALRAATPGATMARPARSTPSGTRSTRSRGCPCRGTRAPRSTSVWRRAAPR